VDRRRVEVGELPDLFAERERLLLDSYRPTRALPEDAPRVGVPRALLFHDLFPLWQAVLSERTELPVTDLAYSPDGSLLAAADASADGRVRVGSVVESKKVVEQYSSGYHSIQPFVAFSADGERLLGGMGDVAIAWERDSGEQAGVLHGYASSLMDLDISPDGERLAYATYNWPVYVHDLEGRTQPRVLSVPDYQAFNVAFTPGGKNVAAGLYSYAPEPRPEPVEMVRMWDVAAGDETQTLPGASAFAYARDGRSISLADSWGMLRVIDLASQKDICLPGCDCDPANGLAAAGSCTLKLPHELSPMKLAYSAESSLLSAWGVAGTWSASGLIDLSTGEENAWFEGGSRISFGPNGLIALGVDELNADHGIAVRWLVLYDLENGKELQRVELPATGVAALSPDGRWLAVGLSSFEKTNPTGLGMPDPDQNGLMIWDVEAWRQVAYYPIHYGITRLAFSPRGDFLITASETGEILRWNRSP
jgi:WD40 repeat protein